MKWIVKGYGGPRCSECHNIITKSVEHGEVLDAIATALKAGATEILAVEVRPESPNRGVRHGKRERAQAEMSRVDRGGVRG